MNGSAPKVVAAELNETERRLVETFRSLVSKGVEELAARAARDVQFIRYPAKGSLTFRVKGHEFYMRITKLAKLNNRDVREQAWVIFHRGLEREEEAMNQKLGVTEE